MNALVEALREYMPRVTVDTDRLQEWAEPLYSLDSPESLEGDQLAAEIAAGFTPGVGTAQGMRDVVRGLRAGDPVEIGLGALGMIPFAGGVTKMLKHGKHAGMPIPTSHAKAKALGFPEEAPYHNISGGHRKLDRPRGELYPDTVATRIDDPNVTLVDEKPLEFEDLEGSVIMRAPGDRSAKGKIVTEIDGLKLPNPVVLEGGKDFMRSGPAWASGKGVINALRKRAAPLIEEGKDVNLMYFPMQHGTMDFNTMMADAMLEQIQAGRHGGMEMIDQLDDAMRAKNPNWPGIMSPEARVALNLHDDASGAARLRFMEELDSAPFEKAGFPNIGVTRTALTDPDLMDVTYLHGGQGVARLDDSLAALPTSHTTYDLEVPGTYLGKLSDEGVPHEMLFPDWLASRGNRPTNANNRSFTMSNAFHTQEVTPEIVDNVSAYIEALRNH